MLLNVKVIPNAKKNQIKEEEKLLKVYIIAPPVEGKANKMLIELLSSYFKTKKSKVTILKGKKSKNKLVKVLF